MRGLRKRLRLSQDRFAESFGLSLDTVRHWESGAKARACLPRKVIHSWTEDRTYMGVNMPKAALLHDSQ